MSTPEQPQGIAALLLAAGAGSRFDASGQQNKLLARIDGVPVAVLSATNLINAGLPVLAVIRSAQTELAALLEKAGCDVSICPDAQLGMGHSLAHGVTVLRDQRNPETIVVALGDMPFISPGITRAVAERVSPQHTIVAAGTSGGQRGHPVAFWHCHFDALQSLRGDQGAGKLLRNHSPLLIDADNNSVIQDIDKPEDLPGACQ